MFLKIGIESLVLALVCEHLNYQFGSMFAERS